MTLEALRVFCAVIEEGSFRAAATRLHRSQPAVSQKLKALEGSVGHPLIDRKGCRPTALGERLYHRARHITTEVQSLARELQDFDPGLTPELRVGTSDTTALYVLPPIVRAFSRALPQTRLVMTTRSSAEVADRVLHGELDLGIVTLPLSHEELEERELFQQRLMLVTLRRHRLGGRARVNLEDLRDEPMLLLNAETRTGALVRDFLRQQNFEPLVALDSGSLEVIKRYVSQGIGVSFLPRAVVGTSDRSLSTAAVPGMPRVRIGAIWRRHAYQTVGAKTFLDLVSKAGTAPRASHSRL